jgi:TetR/AcrR family transcriptional regulator, transcriptional repressor of bet genes
MPGRRAPEDQRREAILAAAFAVAARERLTGLTARAVAAEAGVSSGLVFFYFKSRDALLHALLGWILERTIVAAEIAQLAAEVENPKARMFAIVARDVERLPKQRARVELFFDYWVLGTRDDDIRQTIRAALDRYRDAFVPLAEAVIRADPARFQGADAAGLAGITAAFVEGCALQSVMDPERFEVRRVMRTLAGLLGIAQFPTTRRATRPGGGEPDVLPLRSTARGRPRRTGSSE